MHDLDAMYAESPFLSFLSPSIEDWREGHFRVGLRLRRDMLNRSAVAHGGVIASLLDHAGGMSGLWAPDPARRRYAFTVSLAISYIGQGRGERLTAVGALKRAGGSLFFADATVLDATGGLVASAAGVYKYRKGSEGPEGVPPLQAA